MLQNFRQGMGSLLYFRFYWPLRLRFRLEKESLNAYILDSLTGLCIGYGTQATVKACGPLVDIVPRQIFLLGLQLQIFIKLLTLTIYGFGLFLIQGFSNLIQSTHARVKIIAFENKKKPCI